MSWREQSRFQLFGDRPKSSLLREPHGPTVLGVSSFSGLQNGQSQTRPVLPFHLRWNLDGGGHQDEKGPAADTDFDGARSLAVSLANNRVYVATTAKELACRGCIVVYTPE